jgi:hypothetical protein
MNIVALCKEQRRMSTALYSIARRHQHHGKQHIHGAKTKSWVPEAYRGVLPDAGTKDNDRSARDNRSRRKMYHRNSHKYSPQRKASEKKKEKIMLVKEKEGRLLGLHQELVRVAKEYKRVFSSEPVVEMGNLADLDIQDWKEEKRVLMQTLMKHLQTVFDDVHQADKPAKWAQIEQTEDVFRSLCRLSRSVIIQATQLYREEDSEISEYIELAESALRDLVKFKAERALLVDATKKWSAQAFSITSTTLRSPNSFDEGETSSRTLSVHDWIQKLLGSFNENTTKENSEESAFDDSEMAHKDAALGATQGLFRLVIQSIASAVKKDTDVPESERSRSKREKYTATGERMLNLMEAMPPTWVPEPLIVDQVLAVMSRVGTLESAQKCFKILRKHPSSDNLRFSTVLEAFVEAAKYEEDSERRKVIVENSLKVLHDSWDDIKKPHIRVERINLCCIVLHCMAVSGNSSSPEMCDEADQVMKRALGATIFYRFKRRMSANEGKVGTQDIHLIHFLVQIYASSGEEMRLKGAQRMLEFVKSKDTKGVGLFIVFPNRDTFNSVLKGILRHHTENKSLPNDKESSRRDITYAMGLLDYMLTTKESACWPNEVTFALLFRLLSALKNWDVGELSEELLSKLEIRRSFPGSHDVKINLSAYHHTLGCWLEVAKSSPGKGVTERALRLLDKLEVQSMPLLLSRLEVRKVGNQFPIYDIDLQPNRITYRLVMQICAEAKDPVERQQAVEVAADVYQRMIDRGITPDTDIEDLLKRCQGLLVDSTEEGTVVEHDDVDQETHQDIIDQQSLSDEVSTSEEVVESAKLSG